MQHCPVCQAEMASAFSATVLRKYEVAYFHCVACGMLQTEPPHWLDEAYGQAIAKSDTGLVDRNLMLSAKLTNLLYARFDHQGAYLDCAGGYGMMTRLMRDRGFDYYWQDKYCQNLLAQGFEADQAGQPFIALSAFEVLEHVHQPLEFVQELFQQHGCRTLVFSTDVYTGDTPPPLTWGYYSFATGQHISFYQVRTLQRIAQRLGLTFHSLSGLHVLSERDLRPGPLLKLATGRLAPLLAWAIRRRLGSRIQADNAMLMRQDNPA